MTTIMSLIVNVLVPVALFVAWLLTEFRCKFYMRVGAGLTCLVFASLWIWAVLCSSSMLMNMHGLGITQIERLLEHGQSRQVLQAVQVYNETYRETQSAKAAVFRMNSILLEHQCDREKVTNELNEERTGKGTIPVVE